MLGWICIFTVEEASCGTAGEMCRYAHNSLAAIIASLSFKLLSYCLSRRCNSEIFMMITKRRGRLPISRQCLRNSFAPLSSYSLESWELNCNPIPPQQEHESVTRWLNKDPLMSTSELLAQTRNQTCTAEESSFLCGIFRGCEDAVVCCGSRLAYSSKDFSNRKLFLVHKLLVSK